ncbi:MAG: CehA/McbA family metallohydrolase [Anaerolineae bacterium]
MGKADLHIHSTYSDGRDSVQQILSYVERYTDLDVIAITDHDCLDGALLAQEIVSRGKWRIQVVVGAEISTADGHLLAFDIERLIPANLSMAETVAAVHGQGGLAVAAHPLSYWCPSAPHKVLMSLRGVLDGVESSNASFAGLPTNTLIKARNRSQYGYAEIGGSDAHTLSAIGSSLTHFPGITVAELLNALRSKHTAAVGGLWSVGTFMRYGVVHFRNKLPRFARARSA